MVGEDDDHEQDQQLDGEDRLDLTERADLESEELEHWRGQQHHQPDDPARAPQRGQHQRNAAGAVLGHLGHLAVLQGGTGGGEDGGAQGQHVGHRAILVALVTRVVPRGQPGGHSDRRHRR